MKKQLEPKTQIPWQDNVTWVPHWYRLRPVHPQGYVACVQLGKPVLLLFYIWSSDVLFFTGEVLIVFLYCIAYLKLPLIEFLVGIQFERHFS